MKKISVVIPCFGKDEPIIETINMVDFKDIATLKSNNYDISFLIIGTPDAEGNLPDINLIKKSNENTEMIVEKRRGYGRAYKTGITEAAKISDVIITADADGTYPLGQITSLIQLLSDNVNFVSISRFEKAHENAFSKRNKVGNLLLSFGINVLFFSRIKDSQTGMWVINTSIVDKLKIDQMGDGMEFSSQIKVQALKHSKINFFEIDYDYYPRFGGSPKLRWFKDAIRISIAMFFFRFKYFPFSRSMQR